MKSKRSNRRRFLKESAALAGGLALGAIPGHAQVGQGEVPVKQVGLGEVPVKEDWEAYGVRSRFDKSARIARDHHALQIPTKEHQTTLWTPLQDQMGIITPSGLHFAITHAGIPFPDIDPQQHQLLIHGMVDRPLILTLEDLRRLPSVSRIHFVECNSNTKPTGFGRSVEHMRTVQQTHGYTSCSEWTGVLLSELLGQAGVQKGASWIIAEGVDQNKLVMSIPMSKAMYDSLVVYGQNGEVLRREQGFPLRLLVPGFAGVNNVKWLRRIKVVDQPQLSQYEARTHAETRSAEGRPTGWTWFRYELGPKSVIIRPSGGQRLPGAGFYDITGLAWSGAGVVRRVEVSTDGGRTWKDAQLQEPVLPKAQTRFRLDWNWDGGETVLQSRCTDELGQIQPTLTEYARTVLGPKARPYPPGYPGDVEGLSYGNCNAIQPWKVMRDGSVHNAMFI